jgi:hypothetical protein
VANKVRYACPQHPEVVLFEEEPTTAVNSTAKRTLILQAASFFWAFGFFGLAAMALPGDKPRQCPADGKWYYRHECKQLT